MFYDCQWLCSGSRIVKYLSWLGEKLGENLVEKWVGRDMIMTKGKKMSDECEPDEENERRKRTHLKKKCEHLRKRQQSEDGAKENIMTRRHNEKRSGSIITRRG